MELQYSYMDSDDYLEPEIVDESILKDPVLFETLLTNLQEAKVSNRVEYEQQLKHFVIKILDINKFIKVNECKEITNPMFFASKNVPTPDGLLSNEIFGIDMESRRGIFAYIDLGSTFLDPSCYKEWTRLDSRIKGIVAQEVKYRVGNDGELIEDPEKGKTGIKFLKNNFDKFQFTHTKSTKRDLKISYLIKNKDRMFIDKYPVIPPYYRDIDTASQGKTNVGFINKIYANLINSSIALKSTQDMGFDNTGAICFRIQELLLTLYDWFVGNRNARIGSGDEGVGISGKLGIMRRAVMSKTSDYSSRLVISAPDLSVESMDDMMVTINKSAVPLATIITDFKPFVMFHIRRFFENEFLNMNLYPVRDKNGKLTYITVDTPEIQFSDEVIDHEINRFLHGMSDRFVPVIIKSTEGKSYYMKFRGRSNKDNIGDQSIYDRRLTWCDIFFQAAVEASKGKMILITRFPIDAYTNQSPTEIEVNSTVETEPMYIDDNYYQYYPKIREDMIGKDTSNMFVDTLRMSNLILKGFGADKLTKVA